MRVAVRPELQPAPRVERGERHGYGLHVLCTPRPLPDRASASKLPANPQPPPLDIRAAELPLCAVRPEPLACRRLQIQSKLESAPGELERRKSQKHGLDVPRKQPGPLSRHAILRMSSPRPSAPPPLHAVSSSSPPLQGRTSFNQPLDWNVASVTDMSYMFSVRRGRRPIAPPH